MGTTCGYCGISIIGTGFGVCSACFPKACEGAFAGVNRETFACTRKLKCQRCGCSYIGAGLDHLCQACKPHMLEWMVECRKRAHSVT